MQMLAETAMQTLSGIHLPAEMSEPSELVNRLCSRSRAVSMP